MNQRHDPLSNADCGLRNDESLKPQTSNIGVAQGQRLDSDNLQDVLDAGANAARVGRQQFFTPAEIARALMLPLPSVIRSQTSDVRHQTSFFDPTMGTGALLAASGARDLYGIDIDSRLARKPQSFRQNEQNLSGGAERADRNAKPDSDPDAGRAMTRTLARGQSGSSAPPAHSFRSHSVNSVQTKWHTVCADLTRIYPLLQEIDWRFDLCGLNPPFSVKWHKKRLIGLLDSEVEAVSQTFGDQRSVIRGQIDSTLATFLIALDRMTERGEGFLICSDTVAKRIVDLPIGKHIWLWLTIQKSEASGQRSENPVFGKNVRPFDVAVLYFARGHTSGPIRNSCVPAFLIKTLSSIAPQRALLRRGLSIFHEHDFCPLTRQLWDAARDEWNRRQRSEVRGQRSDYNIWLKPDGTIGRHLTPFQEWSGKITRDKAEALNRLLGQTPMSLVVQRATRLELLDAIGRPQLSTLNSQLSTSPWRVDPALIAAVEKAVGEYHAQRAPFYPLNEVQRLGYLDEEDRIMCKLDLGVEAAVPSRKPAREDTRPYTCFKAGHSYPLTSETIDIEHQEERMNLLGNPEEVTLHGKELAFYIEDSNGDRHSFCGVPPEHQVGRSLSERRSRYGNGAQRTARPTITATGPATAGEHQHDLQALIRHFHIPEVADVAQLDPDRYQTFVDRIREIEAEVNIRNAGKQEMAA